MGGGAGRGNDNVTNMEMDYTPHAKRSTLGAVRERSVLKIAAKLFQELFSTFYKVFWGAFGFHCVLYLENFFLSSCSVATVAGQTQTNVTEPDILKTYFRPF